VEPDSSFGPAQGMQVQNSAEIAKDSVNEVEAADLEQTFAPASNSLQVD
jgi:hypothetical protein